jgi:hypothetical protein
LTPAQGRRFGFTVGGAFLVLAAVTWWRGHAVSWMVLGSLGGLLSAAALVIPTRLGPVERAWMKLAHLISKVTTPIFMGVVYFLVLTPTGLIMRALGRNPLVHGADAGSYWKARPEGARRSASMERQF